MTDRNLHNLIIDVKNLTWGYPNTPSMLFNKFNFALYKNDFTVVMGQSGVGKTTLCNMITGQIKVPIRTIYHKREDISRFTSSEIQLYRRKMGIIFQDYRLIEDFSVKSNIVYPLKLYGLSDSTIQHKYSGIKNLLNIHQIQDNKIKYLSSGEKQKVCIARALIHDPEFIIADEPTGNLDREHKQQIADLLIQANENGNTVLLITHDIHLLEYLKLKWKINLFNM